MIKIERLVFNPFQENTYVLHDDTGECVIVDPGCSVKEEEDALDEFLKKQKLKPVAQIYTHTHIDHILGMSHVYKAYDLKPLMHRDALPFLENASQQAVMFGIDFNDHVVQPHEFLEEGDQMKFGKSRLEVLHTPGHVNGHLSFVGRDQQFVIVGDVLFRDSIGRTDLPSGDFDTLAHQIRTKIYTLGDEFTVYPGHGPDTTIRYEIINNPFVNGR